MPSYPRSVRRLATLGVFPAIFVIGAGLLVYQRHYINRHRPLIKAEIAAADGQGAGLLDSIGVPAGSQIHAGEVKLFADRGRRSMWRGVTSEISWRREWEVPGDFNSITNWYNQRLLADGWSNFDSEPPSTVKREFKRGKWILIVWRMADFTNPTRTRITLELNWDYWTMTDAGR